MKPNRYDLILLFAVVSGIYYVVDETLNNAPPRRTAETLPVVFSVDASPGSFAIIRGLPGLYLTRYELRRPGARYKIIT